MIGTISALNFPASIKVAFGDNQFVAEGGTFRNDFAGWCNDAATADQVAIFLASGFRDADYPGPVLIGTSLHDQVIMEFLKMVVFGRRGIVKRRIVAKHH